MIKMSKAPPRHPDGRSLKCGAKIPRAALEVVKLLASVPIRKTSSGWQFRLRSWEFIGCFLLYLAMLPIYWMVLSEVYPFYVKTFQATVENATKYMNQQIFYELFITLIVPSIITPVTTWLDAPSIAAYLNRFTAFLDLFAATTGRRLQLTLRVKWVLAYGVFCIVSQNIVAQAFPPYLAFWKTSVLAINMITLCTSVTYGVCRTDALSQAGEAVTCCLKRELEAKRCDVRKIVSYERLWLELSQLTTDSSSHYYRTISVPLLLTIYMITISVYGFFASLPDPYFAAFYFVSIILTTAPLYLHCNNAYTTMIKVRDPTMKILTTVRRSQVDSSCWQAVSSFLETIDQSPPVISLGGYAVVDRNFLHSAGATIATYLVVIFQLSMSLQANEKKPCNVSNVLDTTEPTAVPKVLKC